MEVHTIKKMGILSKVKRLKETSKYQNAFFSLALFAYP
jgi:hypothetical protein